MEHPKTAPFDPTFRHELFGGNVLADLPNLREIHVSLHTCPFTGIGDSYDLLRDIWRSSTTHCVVKNRNIKDFKNLLKAVISATVSHIEVLTHDYLHVGFFGGPPELFSFSPAFAHLTSLELSLYHDWHIGHDQNKPDHEYIFYCTLNLSRCLRSASKLQHLSLTYLFNPGFPGIAISPLLHLLREGDFYFRELESLKLAGFHAEQKCLGDFLARQKGLKRLRLGDKGVYKACAPPGVGVALSIGSFKGLFATVEKNLALESFELMGLCAEKGMVQQLLEPLEMKNRGELSVQESDQQQLFLGAFTKLRVQ